MKTISAVIGIASVVNLAVSLASEGSPATVDIARLREELEAGSMVSMRILFVPYDVLTKAPMDSALLRRAAVVDRVSPIDDKLRQRLIIALEQTSVEPLESQPDVRWGAIFLGRDGKELHSIYLDGRYFDGTGRRGIVDGNFVKTNGALGYCLERAFPEFLRISPDDRHGHGSGEAPRGPRASGRSVGDGD